MEASECEESCGEGVIHHREGLHMRPASVIATQVQDWVSRGLAGSVFFAHDEREVDASSILELMTLGASCGRRLRVTVRGGAKRTQVLDCLLQIIESADPLTEAEAIVNRVLTEPTEMAVA